MSTDHLATAERLLEPKRRRGPMEGMDRWEPPSSEDVARALAHATVALASATAELVEQGRAEIERFEQAKAEAMRLGVRL